MVALRSRHPKFGAAVLADAKVVALHRGEPEEFGSSLGAVVQVLRLAWVSDGFFGQVLYRGKARLQALGVPVLPRMLHHLAMSVAQISIGDPVVIEPGIYLMHGQVIIDGMVEIGSGTLIAPWVTIGLRAADYKGPTIERNVFVGTGAKIIGSVVVGSGSQGGGQRGGGARRRAPDHRGRSSGQIDPGDDRAPARWNGGFQYCAWILQFGRQLTLEGCMVSMEFTSDVAIVGGCGHVGLPLGIALADAGLRVVLFDTNATVVDRVGAGKMPFLEAGADEPLQRLVGEGRLVATDDPTSISQVEHVVVVVGTPVDDHLNPDPEAVPAAVEGVRAHLRDGQLLVLRSTVYPGVTATVERLIGSSGLDIDVSFCPERIAEGKALVELHELPQIVSGRTDRAVERATALFANLTDRTVELSIEEAELAKLFTNTWRYIKFAAANQLYMIANDYGLDFERIRSALADGYPRAADMPGPGFAAGPCLLKDTMQLAAFNNNNFLLGHASMMVNEGLPLYLVARLEERFELSDMTVGILGMAFKGESDDIRSSLSYKLRRLLRFKAGRVLCTDPYVQVDDGLAPLTQVLDESDLLIVGAPHRQYGELRPSVPVVDIWDLLGDGVLV